MFGNGLFVAYLLVLLVLVGTASWFVRRTARVLRGRDHRSAPPAGPRRR